MNKEKLNLLGDNLQNFYPAINNLLEKIVTLDKLNPYMPVIGNHDVTNFWNNLVNKHPFCAITIRTSIPDKIGNKKYYIRYKSTTIDHEELFACDNFSTESVNRYITWL